MLSVLLTCGIARALGSASVMVQDFEHAWSSPAVWVTFHRYGCKITETDTIYYCDNIEVGRHATFPLCKERPLFFLINLATGGGWPVLHQARISADRGWRDAGVGGVVTSEGAWRWPRMPRR